MQVFNVIGDKTLKQFMHSEYYSWRANKISEALARKNNRIQQIKMKVLHGSMLTFIEEAIATFNIKQMKDRKLENQIVNTMFQKLGQSPWHEGRDDLFKQYLSKLKDCAHFSNATNNLDGNEHMNLNNTANA